jgi:hypothetical protein
MSAQITRADLAKSFKCCHDIEDGMSEPILCYIDMPWCYFTTQPLDQQTGDDWDDAPYEHNAGDPYTYHEYNEKRGDAPWEIVTIAIRTNLETPRGLAFRGNSRYSVDMINAKLTPWLRTDEWFKGTPVAIYAGTPLSEFIKVIQDFGGRVYVDIERTA